MHRLAFVVLVACGSSPKSAATMPETKADTGPSCSTASGHVVDVLAKTKGDAPPDMLKKISDTLNKHCEQDQWTAASKSCFAKMQTPEDGNACEDGLSPAQKKSLESEDPAGGDNAAPGGTKDKSSGGTRGTPKKGGDPCDGGE